MFDRIPMLVLIALAVALATAACVAPLIPPPAMANPASTYCAEQGGSHDIRSEGDGGEVGYCQFDDGTECEEWAFFRGECTPGDFPASTQLANPASEHCLAERGKLDIRMHDDGGQYGVCLFDDGSECDQWAFFRGECASGGTE